MLFFDPLYLVFVAPALLLMLWAQMKVKSAYGKAMKVPARLSGASAARYLLDQAGCPDVEIEQVGGHLSDHYDPRKRVLRLSRDVYNNQSAAAVGIAAHEAGHALQHARGYMPLVVRNAAVPAAQWGPMASMILLIAGFLFSQTGLGPALILFGIAAFGCVVFFQLVNLPVEFDASRRAKQMLVDYQIVDQQAAAAVSSVLNAAAWTYIAVTLQAVLQFLYLLFRFAGVGRD